MPWITKGILVSMRIRDKLYKQIRQKKDELEKERISRLHKRYRNMIVNLLRVSKKNHYRFYFQENQGNIKKTLDGIRELINVSKKKSAYPSKIFHDKELKSSDLGIANSFNDFFTSIGSSIATKIPYPKNTFKFFLGDSNAKSLFLRPCDSSEILLLLGQMNTSKASGPNSIPMKLLKQFSDILVHPLVCIINMPFKEGIFPSLNKIASVCPIFKKGDKMKCENYRPISLLSNMSKIFEKVMYTRLEDFLKSSGVLYENQFGFRRQHSTSHALLSIVEQIRSSLDKKIYTCGIFVDLEKAFDTVHHEILLSKLDHYGVRGVPNSWFESYLSNRYQTVTLTEFHLHDYRLHAVSHRGQY